MIKGYLLPLILIFVCTFNSTFIQAKDSTAKRKVANIDDFEIPDAVPLGTSTINFDSSVNSESKETIAFHLIKEMSNSENSNVQTDLQKIPLKIQS